MSIVVVYESMFGNTRRIALAIAEGLAPFGVVVTANVNDKLAEEAARSANLVVLGGPTHVHGMTRPASREEATTWANDTSRNLTLEPSAPGTGVREWIKDLELVPALCAAFDTRRDMARILSGAASGHIEHALTKRGSRAVISAESFLVSKDNTLDDGELARARTWGTSVGKAMETFIHH
ncbi:hypothetical protein ART_0348 [Arthrobacter sp. PAMC 25486]|uniref:flavodoxin family protein n=1 Tax=Arthrobacter sp. PAMC 25486 TaxID=1494608 RepID=UPI000535BFB7|nr:flavodoxin family protein [Arthrobacter sp. PAMC 25486]AIX99946.1 hypothetical protein ART_0348 [Arthrobacter sp. PAMC 25486]